MLEEQVAYVWIGYVTGIVKFSSMGVWDMFYRTGIQVSSEEELMVIRRMVEWD